MTNHLPQAEPRIPEEAWLLDRDEAAVERAVGRGVESVVHFTTTFGLAGILASGAVMSRRRLEEADQLEYVYRPNALFRKDRRWLDYINLSVARINDWMFSTSERWHAANEVSWVVLNFDPQILGDPGVVFTTTNNIYPKCRRALGVEGFEQMFMEPIAGRYDEVHRRIGLADCFTTDRQAEVLYPGVLQLDLLRTVDVRDEDSLDDVEGMLGVLPQQIALQHRPEVFL